jgi:hypothetical protein
MGKRGGGRRRREAADRSVVGIGMRALNPRSLRGGGGLAHSELGTGASTERNVSSFSFRGLLSRNHESICVGRFGLSSGVAIEGSDLGEAFGFQEILKLGKAEDSEFVYLRNLLVAAFGITKGEGKRVSPRIVMPIELVFAGSDGW